MKGSRGRVHTVSFLRSASGSFLFSKTNHNSTLLKESSNRCLGFSIALAIPFIHRTAMANAALDTPLELRQAVVYNGYLDASS